MKSITIFFSILMIVVSIIFLALNLNSVDKYSNMEVKTVSNISNLNVDLDTTDIIIEFSDVDTPTFSYSKSLNKHISISQDDSTARLSEKKSFFSFGNIKNNTIQVKLPYNTKLENLNLNLINSNLDLKNLVVEGISANLSQGNLIITNSIISNSRFKLEMGDM
ncbi:DUF4097 family beta strand repeat protein [Gemella sp. 19428wG2_WT2a]|nr:DUF4097 family beta strand repeat protein [Gemella sp. 19428wG2_WT2a]TFU60053.1 hypothetical protein E4T67_03450 [Gemella sp. WT2a]